MTLARTWSIGLTGVTGHLVTVEADLSAGLPGTAVIGMPDPAIIQSRDRIRAAIVNSGHKWPDRRITLALSPAGLRKSGAGYDIALAVAVLAAAGVVPAGAAGECVLIGELGLDGAMRPVRGVLPALLAARAAGRTRAVVPLGNLAEAALVTGMAVWGAPTLADLIASLMGRNHAMVKGVAPGPAGSDRDAPDLADVLGQPEARLALEVAAAGGHHLAMIGPPGAGKTMLASRLPGVLPPLDDEQSLEVTAVHSVAGLLDEGMPLITRPPFVDPHHSASQAAIIGGGSAPIRPGSVSLAHCGVLFLDEAPEFGRRALDALRQPLEEGSVVLARASGVVRFPARFQLVLAANPCPCAAAKDVDCRCGSHERRSYLNRLSGPLMDRVDIRIDLPALPPSILTAAGGQGESSAVVAQRVRAARDRASFRWRETPWRCTAQVPGAVVRRMWSPDDGSAHLLDRAVRTGRLTGRGYDRVLRLSLTVADLAGRDVPTVADVASALALRCAEAS
ncbi:MAG: YifB family Mg chelatase-like AAA ATPase [Nakamurella multipartita]